MCLYFIPKIDILGLLGSQEIAANMYISWELLKITVRRKTGEGRRVRRKSLSQAVKTSRSHEEGDKGFPKEIPKGEVPSAEKKCFS